MIIANFSRYLIANQRKTQFRCFFNQIQEKSVKNCKVPLVTNMVVSIECCHGLNAKSQFSTSTYLGVHNKPIKPWWQPSNGQLLVGLVVVLLAGNGGFMWYLYQGSSTDEKEDVLKMSENQQKEIGFSLENAPSVKKELVNQDDLQTSAIKVVGVEMSTPSFEKELVNKDNLRTSAIEEVDVEMSRHYSNNVTEDEATIGEPI